MTSPSPLELFQQIVSISFLTDLCTRCEFRFRQGIYTPIVVLWLMICQRLQGKRTLSTAVMLLLQGGASSVCSDCKRVLDDHISARTGGFSHARKKMPKLVVTEVTDHILEQLRSRILEASPGPQGPVCLIDGSTLQLMHEPELVKAYPPGRNRHGSNHWPGLCSVAFHDPYTGLALRPSWGPMYGRKPVSEQGLAEEALQRLPANAVVLGDCNFGIFAFAYAVQQSRRPMILRLTKARAQKISGERLKPGSDTRVTWTPSRWERKRHPRLPPEAQVSGRLIVCENPARPHEELYLFTDLELPVPEVMKIYGLRWNIETDLRSLKRTRGLHRLSSKDPDMMEKELLLAVSAYNLVRAVMCLAAETEGLKPRDLSFSVVQDVVQAALPGLGNAASQTQYRERFERMLRIAAQAKLPQRRHPRSYPREVWGRGSHFPPRKRKGRAGGHRRPQS